ncbi:MAG: methyl-accepting chemotaxis protein [Spirochaetes bacterium]|nr:methyl-accepting chemotaxis protein [Spirochaetota bacterium]
MFQSLSLRAKILIGFFSVILITGIIGGFGWYGLSVETKNIKQLGNLVIPSILNIEIVLVRQERIKTAIRTLCSPYLIKEDLQRQFENIEKARSEYRKALQEYEKLEMTSEEKQLYADFLQKLELSVKENNAIIEEAKKLLTLPEGTERTRLIQDINQKALSGANREAFDRMTAALVKLLEYIKSYYGEKEVHEYTRVSNLLVLAIQILLVVGIILAVVLGLLITKSIVKPLNQTTNNLTSSSNNLEGAANQIASASQELSSGASELASSVEEITSSMEELQSIIESNTKSVNEAELLMKETAEGAKASSARSEELLAMMQEINERSRQVVRINKVIDDIAFQTSILALNAAVEAARAGEAGRGFAVVADQVKSLAQKSAEASNETSELIESVVANIEKGTERTRAVAEDSKKVSEAAGKVSVLLDEITRAFKEQSKGANQVTKAISQVNTVVQQTASSSEETAAAAEEMQAQVEALREIVQTLNEVAMGKGKGQEKETMGTKKGTGTVHGQVSRGSIKKSEAESADRIERKEGSEGSKRWIEGRGARASTSEVELITPEQKIPLEDFKDF